METPSDFAVAAATILQGYAIIHDDVFASSAWRRFRRVVPIPGLFEAVNYGTHSVNLNRLRSELVQLRARAGSAVINPDSVNASTFLECFARYTHALTHTIGRLEELCDGLADASENRGGHTWQEYQSHVTEYERLRGVQLRLGIELNGLNASMRDEA